MKKMTINDFINKANIIHNNVYDYSLTNYISSKQKVIIICRKHGKYLQIPDSHLHGHGCPICGKYNTKEKQLKLINEFINNANRIHNNKYDYSQVKYVGIKRKIDIICNKHGIFKQTPDSHLHGRGCPKCVNRNCTTPEFILKANYVHDYKYNYELVNYINPKQKIKIICDKHGEYMQSPNSHLSGRGCPICKSSKGEIAIINYLKNKNIKYIREKKFLNCKNKHRLPFDFYLPNHNVLIEYDGEQHYRPINFCGNKKNVIEKFNQIVLNDGIKNQFAIENNIKLIRISYQVNDIANFLDDNLFDL